MFIVCKSLIFKHITISILWNSYQLFYF